MADKKIKALTDIGNSISAAELLHVVDDPTGTPINKKITAADVFNNIPSFISFKDTAQTATGDGSTNTVITLTESTSLIDATSAAAPCTLAAAGTDGQVKMILNASTGGTNNITITPTNFKEGTTITLNAPGESVVCMYKSSFWYVIGGNGYAVA